MGLGGAGGPGGPQPAGLASGPLAGLGLSGQQTQQALSQLSNPQYRQAMSDFMGTEFGQQMFRNMINSNPQFQQMLDQNPAMRCITDTLRSSCVVVQSSEKAKRTHGIYAIASLINRSQHNMQCPHPGPRLPKLGCRSTLENPEQMRRMMAPESLQAMMSMAQQLEQLGLGPGMQQGGAGALLMQQQRSGSIQLSISAPLQLPPLLKVCRLGMEVLQSSILAIKSALYPPWLCRV